MRRSVIAFLLSLAFSAFAQTQNRSTELDKAYEETRTAYLALKAAEARRDQGLEAEPGERQGTAAGGASRPNEDYFVRQAQLEHEVEVARKRYEAAAKRWNDLK